MDEKRRDNLLAELVQANTIGGNEQVVSEILAKYFRKHGINCKLIPIGKNRSDFYAQMGTGHGPVLALSGHQDVVKLGNLDEWEFPPLSAQVSEGKMFGRGTTDMKSGLAALALAMMELADEGVKINGQLKFLGTVGEETSKVNHMQGAKRFADDGYLDNVERLLIAEPTGCKVVFSHKGSITYEITSKGKAAHSSTPELGFDAIKPLIKYYEKQQEYFSTLNKENKYLGKTVPVVTKIEGGDQLNSVPDSAALFVKMRTIPEIANEQILLKIKELVNLINDDYRARLNLKLLGNKIPVITDPNASFVNLVKAVAENRFQQEVPLEGISGGTDASEMRKVNPKMQVVIFGPGSKTAHQENEYVELKQFNCFIDIYKTIIKKFFSIN
ncbi:MAG: ArgE/DapE family deacylase [Liquorilactobacillus nagelii]|uniref:ArgE/DapE family deacylase n=1 Tax=Liquorilactobacillus nagelii TaxID=82688 RepID=UPI0039E8C199